MATTSSDRATNGRRRELRMDILYLLVPLSILLVFAIGGIFWWALNHRQFEELDQVGQSIIDDKDS